MKWHKEAPADRCFHYYLVCVKGHVYFVASEVLDDGYRQTSYGDIALRTGEVDFWSDALDVDMELSNED
jgi:hypothetical protein